MERAGGELAPGFAEPFSGLAGARPTDPSAAPGVVSSRSLSTASARRRSLGSYVGETCGGAFGAP
jgi:hypothetical protein